jgi:hypothetical protein
LAAGVTLPLGPWPIPAIAGVDAMEGNVCIVKIPNATAIRTMVRGAQLMAPRLLVKVAGTLSLYPYNRTDLQLMS